MARVCSQEERTEIASGKNQSQRREILAKTQTTEAIKESHPGVIHLLTVLSEMIARP